MRLANKKSPQKKGDKIENRTKEQQQGNFQAGGSHEVRLTIAKSETKKGKHNPSLKKNKEFPLITSLTGATINQQCYRTNERGLPRYQGSLVTSRARQSATGCRKLNHYDFSLP